MPEEEIPPDTALINSIRAEKSPYYSWAGEAIDNALDAQATVISLDMTKESLDCKDNGIGVTQDRDQKIVKISGHGEMEGTKLGRFGVGIKFKSIQHGKSFHIQSVSKDGRLRRTVNWEAMLTSGRWMYPLAIRTEVPPGTATGTLVSIRGLITRPPRKTDIERTKYEVRRRYYPALESGKVITINGENVEPIEQPVLLNKIEATLSFPGGRSANILGGMLVEPHATKLRQVDVCVAYRVIKPESAFGCNGYGGIRQMYAKVVLNGPWKLTKFKDDIAEDPYLDALEFGVEGVLRPILERCQSASMFLKTKRLEELLNEMLPQDQRLTRPEKKQDLGRKGDKDGDKRIKDVTDSNPSRSGPTQKKKPARGILIEFAPDLHETHGFGRSQVGKSSTRIQLASDNPHIAILMNLRDEQTAKIGLYAIAMLLYEGDQPPRLVDEPIGLRAWRLAGQQTISKSETVAAGTVA